MPTYSIDGPDGKSYSIDGPEGASRDQVIAKIKEKKAITPRPDEGSTMGDVATSFGRGVAKGTIALAGLPGDLGNLFNRGINKAEESVGLTPQPVSDALTTPNLTKKVESVTGEFGAPKTTAGKYAESVGEFVPSAAIGPGKLATKAATTIAGGLGAEAGGEMAGETGRFIGGLAGGAGAGAVGAEAQSRHLASMLPDTDKYKKAAQAAYKAIENSRATVGNASISVFTTGVKADLENALIDRSEAPAVFRAVDNLPKGGGEIASIMGLYENLGKVAPSEGTKYTAANIARQGVLDFLDKLQPHDVQGDIAFNAAMWQEARGNWSAHKKLEMFEEARDKAERQAGKSGTGTNAVNTMRQRMDEILNSEKKSRGLPDDVKDKIKEIVVGTPTTNTARFLGKFSGGPLSSAWPVLTGLEAGVPAGAAVAAGSTIARHLGTYLTERQIREVENMIKAAGPIGKPVAAAQAGQQPNFQGILPAAALRSEMAKQANSPLAAPGQ